MDHAVGVTGVRAVARVVAWRASATPTERLLHVPIRQRGYGNCQHHRRKAGCGALAQHPLQGQKYRHAPQVERVRNLPEESHRTRAEEARPRISSCGGADHDNRGHDRERQQRPAEEVVERFRLIEALRHEPQGERQYQPPGEPGERRPEREQEPGRTANEDRQAACVGPGPEPATTERVLGQPPPLVCGHAGERDNTRQSELKTPAKDEDQEWRPEEIELLLERQRPQWA